MKRNAYSERYIRAVGKRLRHLARISDLNDPENVKDAIARKNCSNAFKETLIDAYLNMIIANASKKMALILSVIKDLGL